MSKKQGFRETERVHREKGLPLHLGCPSGKRTFATRSEARRYLKRTVRQMRSRGETKILRYVYGCRLCGHWHTTSREPTR